MKKILIGNDIRLTWTLKNTKQEILNLGNPVVKILHQDTGKSFIPDFTAKNNELRIFFPAERQKELGIYHLTLAFKDGNNIRVASRETFYLSDIYEADIYQCTEENSCVEIDIINVVSELSYVNGKDGEDGKDGKSAYEVAIENGFEGTEEEWLESLIPEPAPSTLQEVTDKGNSTTNNLVINEAVIGNNSESGNIFFGKNALSENTTGKGNTALGNETLVNNTVANELTGIGHKALHSFKDTVKPGGSITAVGFSAGEKLETGSNSTIVGSYGLYSAKKTIGDTVIGSATLQSYTGASFVNIDNETKESGRNTTIGQATLQRLSAGYGNTAIGYWAGASFKQVGDLNTFIGYAAGVGVGNYGSRAVIIGTNSAAQGDITDRLIIQSNKEGEKNHINLIDGSFSEKDKHLKVGGKLILHTDYLPEVTESFNRQLVIDDLGNVSAKTIENQGTATEKDKVVNYPSESFIYNYDNFFNNNIIIELSLSVIGKIATLNVQGSTKLKDKSALGKVFQIKLPADLAPEKTESFGVMLYGDFGSQPYVSDFEIKLLENSSTFEFNTPLDMESYGMKNPIGLLCTFNKTIIFNLK